MIWQSTQHEETPPSGLARLMTHLEVGQQVVVCCLLSVVCCRDHFFSQCFVPSTVANDTCTQFTESGSARMDKNLRGSQLYDLKKRVLSSCARSLLKTSCPFSAHTHIDTSRTLAELASCEQFRARLPHTNATSRD